MMSENKNNLDMLANPSVLPKDALHQGMSVIHTPHFQSKTAPSENANGLHMILNGLRRRWKWALPLGLLLSSGAAALVFCLFKPSFEAVATLKIEAHPEYIAFQNRADEGIASKSYVQTQINSIRHPVILRRVLANPEIVRMPEIAAQPDPVKWLQKQIAVKQQGDSELYDVMYAAPDPIAAAKVVNVLLDEYFNHRTQTVTSHTQDIIRALEQELNTREQDLRLKRANLQELTKQNAGKDPFSGAVEPLVVVNHPLADLQNHLANAEVEQAVLKAKIKAYKDAASQEVPISEAMIENKIDMHPEVMRYKQEIANLKIELRMFNSVSKRGDKNIDREIQEYEKSLAQIRKDLQKQMRSELQSAAAAKRDEQIAALQTELDTQQITAEMFRERCDSQMKDVKQTSGDTLQVRFKQSELDRAEKVYGTIAQRIVELRTETGRPERVTIFSPAIAPTSPIEVFPYRNFLLAALAGFALPFGLALGLEKLICRVGDASNLESASQLPIVGEIARLPSRRRGVGNPAATLIGLDLRMFQESIDSLRTTLMVTEELCNLRVLAVTSATTHEGKTSVATQLAISLARTTNEPTLLIDGDMRSPNLHDIFDVPLEPGLTKILEGKISIEEAIVPTSCPLLDLLPAGKLAGNPHQLLGKGAPTALLQSIPEKYRYVIIDTPPVLAASESLMLARMADATLVCALRDVSRIDQIKKAYQRLLTAGGKPVGLVLNGVPTKTYAYHYGSYAYANR